MNKKPNISHKNYSLVFLMEDIINCHFHFYQYPRIIRTVDEGQHLQPVNSRA